jgi:hypothetical protein
MLPDVQETALRVTPRGGVAGTEVQVRMTRLPPNTGILIGFGGIGSPHEILSQTESDADGVISVTVKVPAWVERNTHYLFYWAFADQRPRTFSDAFLVTGPDGIVRVEGRITDEGGACTAMRGAHDALFTLTGNTGTVATGDRVVVEATVAEASTCRQGTTLAVRTLRIAS